jgi:thiol-disulfide isomerase/thioredoxin
LEPVVRLAIACLPVAPILLSAALLLAGCDKQKPSDVQGKVADVTATDSMPTNTIGRVDITHRGEAAPAVPFQRPDGAPATLASFRGKALMVNLWATWCAPCVKEMPALDTLAGSEAGRFQVLAVSQDMGGAHDVAPFFAKKKFTMLQPYLDQKNVLMGELGLDTLPTTIFYDAAGKEQWRVLGAMDWGGERAKTLIDGAMVAPGKG